jgi:hypothetical protein
MADTIAGLRATLAERLGLDTLSTVETSRLEEVINAAIALTLSDGVPAMLETVVGVVPGDLSVTVSSHSAGSATVTLSGAPDQTRRGDLFVDLNGDEWPIRGVSGAALDIGTPAQTSLAGSGTIKRRTILLPHAGRITHVAPAGSGTRPLVAGRWGFDTESGSASYYQQIWDTGNSYAIIWPAPASSDRFVIKQELAVTKDTTIDVPNGVIETILAKAVVLYVAWTSGQYQPVVRSQRDADDLATESGESGVYTRG